MKISLLLAYIYLTAVWVANITDLIKGHWFYPNTFSAIWFNSLGIISMVAIILDYEIEIKKFKVKKK